MIEYSILTHDLPTSIKVKDKEYKIDARVCKVLQALYILSMDELDLPFRIGEVTSLLLGDDAKFEVGDFLEVWDEIVKFLGGYPKKNTTESKKQVLSFSQDHDIIYSAFRQAYGLTLTEIKNMHYWEFLSLLAGLPADTRLSGVIQIRLTEITSKDSAEVRRAKIKAKQAVSIKPRVREGQERESGTDIISNALNDENDE